MNIKILSAIVAVTGLLAVTACKSESGSGGSSGGSGGSSVGGSGGSSVGGSSVGGTGGSGSSCYTCACSDTSGGTPAGCADTCDNTISGAATPNFCNGSAALSQCEACIADRCGSTSANCQ